MSFLYYITCFCGIYVNTQIHLIKDSIISFCLDILYSFCICLIPGIFRIPALRAKKKNKKYLYNFLEIFSCNLDKAIAYANKILLIEIMILVIVPILYLNI